MCGYIQWAQINNITLKFKPTAEDNAHCLAFGDSKLYHISYGLDEMWKLSSTDFIKEVFHYSDLVRIQTEFNNNKPFLSSTTTSLPKFIHYAAHAETLSQLLEGLELHRFTRGYPSSALFIEFLEDKAEKTIHVKISFHNGETQEEGVLRVPG